MISAPISNNGTTKPSLHGVFAPLNAFYLEGSEDLDIPTFQKHAIRIASAGVGLVVNGSMGEAVHLSHAERNILIAAARQALDDNNLTSTTLLAGTGACSTRETIEFCKEAAEAGADYSLLIAPGYFVGALDAKALKAYFVDVAEASPIPVVMYNYPGASSGIDLNTDLIADIAATSNNIVGIKLTCGSVGKLTRLVSLPNFVVIGGFVDFLAPSLLLKSAGVITGSANVFPKSCLKLYHLTLSGLAGNPTDLAASVELQELVSAGDWALQKGGISGTKYALSKTAGYGGAPRRPILPYSGDGDALMKSLEKLWAYEKSL